MAKTISVAKLRKLGACQSQVAKFKEIFGDKSVAVTVELCVAHAQDFNWDWAAGNVLTASAKAEYNRVAASAMAEYNRVVAPAWATAYLNQ